MAELGFYHIPAVARRIAHDELAKRISVLEAELAKGQASSADLLNQLTLAREQIDGLRRAETERAAEAEDLRSTLAARESAERACDAARAETEALLVRAESELQQLQLQEAHHIGEITKLQSRLVEREAAVRASEEVRAETEARLAQVESQVEELRLKEAHSLAELTRLQSTLVEREAAVRASEEVRAETEARLARFESQIEELRLKEAHSLAELTRLQSTLVEREAAVRASEEVRTSLEAQVEALSRQLDELQMADARRETTKDEIATCRALAEKCVFIVGFARSNTTITLEMLNCASNALILGEADFFLDGRGDRFSDWYNQRHCDFQNQVTKSSCAPDFLPETPHTWWQWLDSAAKFYDCIGEKIALSDQHLSKASPDALRAFYEARFLRSRYIFMLRNPIDVLLSSAKLMSIVDDAGIAKLCTAWLDFMQLWADFIRVFPRTMTVVGERFGEATVRELEAFTGLELGDARLLINPANKRRHKLPGKFPTLVRLKPEFEKLYASAVAAADENRALWQAEQKRNAPVNETTGSAVASVAVTPRPLGRVWLGVQELRKALPQPPKKVGQ